MPISNYWSLEQPDVVFQLRRGAFAPDAETMFNLASVSKEFTGGAILLLEQDGKLSLSNPVLKYFPSAPVGMTLLNLLQHSTGLVEYNQFGDPPDFFDTYKAFIAGGQTTLRPVIDRLLSLPLKFEPGSQYDYSNSNYMLLGAVVAQVSGQSLGGFLEQRIFIPLEMTHTQQGYPPPPVTDLALGYKDDGLGVVRTWQWNLAWLDGPSGLTSTVGDLEKWDLAVRAPGLFAEATLTKMFTPGPFTTPVGAYANGLVPLLARGASLCLARRCARWLSINERNFPRRPH